MTSPPRIPKGSKEGGRFMPKWAAELRDKQNGQHQALLQLADSVGDLRERLGTSTPLIIWNIAVLIWVAGLTIAVMRLYGYAP